MAKRQPLPRSVMVDRLMAEINGVSNADPTRAGYMSRERANETLDMWKSVINAPMEKIDGGDELRAIEDEVLLKNVSLGTGLSYYDLRGPALNLFPTVTPLRNSIARNSRANPGDALHYKAIFATIGSGFPYMGWVPEGHRAASMSYTAIPKTVPYATLGEEDSLTDEAKFAAEGFEDESAMVQLRLLLKMFVKEEAAILGGNSSLTLSAPGTITSAATGSGATLPALTYSAYCVALTQEGYQNATAPSGVGVTPVIVGVCPTAISITGNDGSTFTLNGGSSALSANKTQAVTLGQTLSLQVPVVRGAVAYAWFVGAAGLEYLQAITTISSVTFASPILATGQLAASITGDHSNNGATAFDGLLTTAFNSANNAYYYAMPLGTAGVGTGLTASGHGGIVEIDTMLISMWNTYKVGVTVIYVNAQELNNITAKVLTNSSAPLLRYDVPAGGEGGSVEYKLTAGGVVAFYFNPFTASGGERIPIKIHPNLAPGTILGYCERLPAWYVSNETPMVAEILTRTDYTNEVWPRTNRVQYYGVYAQETLAVYAPFACGTITNIANA
jgi:hypothetical protein